MMSATPARSRKLAKLVNEAEPLGAGAIHVWMTQYPSKSDPAEYVDTISDREKGIAASCSNPEARARYIFTRATIRLILGRYAGVEPANLELATSAAGKPFLKGDPSEIRFNLSHSGRHLVVAIARHEPIGIDIESPRPGIGNWLSAFASRDEVSLLATFPEHAIADAATRLWVAKEALLKARGSGLGYEPTRITIAPQLLAKSTATWVFDGQLWRVSEARLHHEVVCALAWRAAWRCSVSVTSTSLASISSALEPARLQSVGLP
jgi:4'-phosphopantetheinyl transferase